MYLPQILLHFLKPTIVLYSTGFYAVFMLQIPFSVLLCSWQGPVDVYEREERQASALWDVCQTVSPLCLDRLSGNSLAF